MLTRYTHVSVMQVDFREKMCLVHTLEIIRNLQNLNGKQTTMTRNIVSFLLSAVTTTEASSSPAALTPKKDYIYETKEEAKQAFKELLKEKVWYGLVWGSKDHQGSSITHSNNNSDNILVHCKLHDTRLFTN